MKHIAEEYGSPTNLLELSPEELKAIEPFLKGLGVRVRLTKRCGERYTIQGENPYKKWMRSPNERRLADQDMSEEGIKAYKR